VGLIQRALEAEGIRTAAITHLPKVTQKVRPPRSLSLRFPLGRSFGGAGSSILQREILLKTIQFAATGDGDTIIELPYRWKRD
jgi:hypothetical protein